jgi:tetratricopeptide (TPR) repeat protein
LSENISEFYFYSKAADYLRQRDLINAQRYIDTSLVLNPNFGPSYFKLHQIVENKDSSIKFISKAISLDKKNGFVYFPYRSWLYYDKNDFPNALRDINIYLESYPKSMPLDLERFLWKLAVLLDAGNTGEAIQEFDTLSTAQIEQIKYKGNDSYNMIIEKCKRK